MIFKIHSTEVHFSFSFLAILILFLIKDTRQVLLISLITSLVHEVVHIIFLLLLKCRIEKVGLSLFGGNIVRDSNDKTTSIGEAIIHLSAPVFNIFLGIIIYIFNRESHWAQINILIGVFNLMPFYNFDGGNALYHLTRLFTNENNGQRVVTLTSCIFVVLFTGFNLLFSLKNNINISFVIINIYFIAMFVYKLFKKTTRCV